jgi:hypothetical protein
MKKERSKYNIIMFVVSAVAYFYAVFLITGAYMALVEKIFILIAPLTFGVMFVIITDE